MFTLFLYYSLIFLFLQTVPTHLDEHSIILILRHKSTSDYNTPIRMLFKKKNTAFDIEVRHILDVVISA